LTKHNIARKTTIRDRLYFRIQKEFRSTHQLELRCSYCHFLILSDDYDIQFDKYYHLEHMYCSECSVPVKNNYEVKESSIVCQNCFNKLNKNTCAFCNKLIGDNEIVINTTNKVWHVNHFVCQVCHRDFENGEYYERDGYPHCKNHQEVKCKSCNNIITGRVINALDALWCQKHFACQICWKPYGPRFSLHNGFPYCELHSQTKIVQSSQ